MRATWTQLPLLLLLFASPSAFAQSRLKLTSDRPMVIVVNLVPHTVGPDSPATIEFAKGKEGTQRITVRNLLSQVVHQGTIVVPKDYVVTVAWTDRQLEVVDRKLLKTSQAYNIGGAGVRTDNGRRTTAGAKELDALAAQSGEPTGDLLSLAAESVGSAPQGDTGLGVVVNELDPPGEAVPVAPLEGSTSVAVTGKGSSQSVDSRTLAGGDAADAAVVRLIPRSQSWANVWVGDQKVWEYRGKGDVLEVRLPAGPHTIQIKDFRDQDGWGKGTLTLAANQTATVQFSMAQPIETQGGSWVADK